MKRITFVRKGYIVGVVFNSNIDAARMNFGMKFDKMIVEDVA